MIRKPLGRREMCLWIDGVPHAVVIPFKPTYRRSRESELWDRYLFALAKVQDEHPAISVESCRQMVAAYDAWRAEYLRNGGAA